MSSGRRVADGVHGVVYERAFDTVRAVDDVEQVLDRATRAGALVEFKLDHTGLVTRRKWFDGTPIEHWFRDADEGDRRKQSVTVFSKLGQELRRLEDAGISHGAIHPSNVLIANGLQLVDAVANTTRLGVREPGLPHGALWYAARPLSISWADWDRANLLRMSALLGLPRDGETTHLPFAMLQMCRTWAARAIEALPAGSHSEQAIEGALQAAARVAQAIPPQVSLAKPPAVPGPVATLSSPPPRLPSPPAAPQGSPPEPRATAPQSPPSSEPAGESGDDIVAEIAQSLFRAVGAGRMLHSRLEEQIVQVAGGRGVASGQARAAMTHWLRRKNYARESDLLDDARRVLRAGVHHQVWIPVNVVMNAQRTFLHHEVGPRDAEAAVAGLLRELGLKDERDGEREWGARLDAYIGKNCPKKTFTSKQCAEMCSLVASFGVPKDMAEQVTKRYLDKHGLTEKNGWFG